MSSSACSSPPSRPYSATFPREVPPLLGSSKGRSCPELANFWDNNPGQSPNESSSSSDFFLDECQALLEQVPDSFDLGLTPVRLCSLAASPSSHYLAIGSQCGALFLFNRRLGQSVKPLRTNYREVISLLQFQWPSPDGRDQLAVGHQSGTLVLLALPSEQNAKLSQHVQEEAHRDSPISAICWSPDGSILFSGDQSGLVLAIRVDFSNGQFPVDFVASEFSPISAIATHQHFVAFATLGTCKIVSAREGEDFGLLAKVDFGQAENEKLLGLAFSAQGQLAMLRSDGKLFGWKEQEEARELGDLSANLSAEERVKWAEGSFGNAEVGTDPMGPSFALWNGPNLLICRLWEGGFGLELLDLGRRMGEPGIRLLALTAPSADEFFLLALPRRVFRLSRLCPAPSILTVLPASSPPVQKMPANILGSLLAAGRAGKRRAQGILPVGTEEVLGKLNKELDVFLMGEGGKEGGGEEEAEGLGQRLAAGFLLLPGPERVAQGLQQVIGQMRQSSDFDHWSMAGTSRDFSRERESLFEGGKRESPHSNRSLPTELSQSLDEDREELLSLLGEEMEGRGKGEEGEVRVRRRRIMQRRKGRSRRSGGGALRALAEERASRASALDQLEAEEGAEKGLEGGEAVDGTMAINEEKQRKIMEVLNGIIHGGEEGQRSTILDEEGAEKEEEAVAERDVLEQGGGRAEEVIAFEDDEEEEGMCLMNGLALDGQPIPGSSLTNHLLDLSQLLPDRPCSPEGLHSSCSPPTSSSLNSMPMPPAPLYSAICRLANTADSWARLEAPFPLGHFSLCRHYLLVCPRRRGAHRAHFLTIGALARAGPANGTHQLHPHWGPLRLHGEAIALNDSGTRIWRVSNGVGYSPTAASDPIGLSSCLSKCQEWCEMTSPNEGKLLQVALTSRNAWYLTDKGVFVQMCLPESGIGIWFRAQEDEDPPAQFGQIAASEHAVWALNGLGMVAVRTGLRHCPMGVDWAQMDGQPKKFASIELFEKTGFGLDFQGALWFVHGVAKESPFGVGPWLKAPPLPSPAKCSPISEWRLKVGEAGIFLNIGPALLHTVSLTGHSFEHVVPERLVCTDHFALLTAGAFSGMANDCLFGCVPHSSELLAFSLRFRAFLSLPPLPSVLSICACPEWLFALDQPGIVHAWQTGPDPSQSEWIRFGQPAKFGSVAISSASIWAISQHNSAIWACRFRPSEGFTRLDWMEIDGPVGKEKPDQIRTSPSGQSIWLFSSSSGLAWTRTDLSARNWRGRSWFQANEGIRLSELAVADSAVWALGKGGGQLHRLARPQSMLGSPVWRPLDFRLKAISVDALEGRLWGLDSEFRIVRLEVDTFPRERPDQNGLELGDATGHTQMLYKAREMPERTLSGASADSWGVVDN